jgi:Tfp pilus assembly protein PilV
MSMINNTLRKLEFRYKTETNIHTRKLPGFSLVEVLLSVTLFTLFVLGLSGGLAYSMQSSEVTSYKAKALFLADEGLEAVRSIRNSSYDALVLGTHGLNSTGSSWAFDGTVETIDEYTRSIEITNVNSTTKQVTSKVTWPATVGGSNTITTSVYLTNWLREIAQFWTNPKLGNVLDIAGNQDASAITYSNGYAYAVRNSGSPNLITVNVSETTPSITNLLNSSIVPNNIFVAPTGSYLATTSTSNSAELVIYSLSNPGVPNQIFAYNATGNADALASYIDTNNHIYMVRASSTDPELLILDATNTQSPTLIGTAQYGSTINDIVVAGNYAYVATSNTSQELVVFNISNPASSTVVGTYNAAGNSQGTSIAVFDNTLLLGTAAGNVFAVNIATPNAPTSISTFYTGASSRVNEISLKNDNTMMFLATANATKAFIVVNITNITTPVQLSSLNVTGSLTGVTYDSGKDKVYGVGSNNSSEFVVINSN